MQQPDMMFVADSRMSYVPAPGAGDGGPRGMGAVGIPMAMLMTPGMMTAGPAAGPAVLYQDPYAHYHPQQQQQQQQAPYATAAVPYYDAANAAAVGRAPPPQQHQQQRNFQGGNQGPNFQHPGNYNQQQQYNNNNNNNNNHVGGKAGGRGQQGHKGAGGPRGGKQRHTAYNSKGELCMTVVDPATRKLLIPLPFIYPSRAQQRTTLPSLCQLFLQNRCHQGTNCYQVHASWDAVQALRAQVDSLPCCCVAHGDKDVAEVSAAPAADGAAKGLGDVVLRVPGCTVFPAGLVPLVRVSYTQGLRQLLRDQDPLAAAAPPLAAFESSEPGDAAAGGTRLVLDGTDATVCRLHATDRCRYAEECKFLHLCKEITNTDVQLTRTEQPQQPKAKDGAAAAAAAGEAADAGAAETGGEGGKAAAAGAAGAAGANSGDAPGVSSGSSEGNAMMAHNATNNNKHSSPFQTHHNVFTASNNYLGAPQRQQRPGAHAPPALGAEAGQGPNPSTVGGGGYMRNPHTMAAAHGSGAGGMTDGGHHSAQDDSSGNGSFDELARGNPILTVGPAFSEHPQQSGAGGGFPGATANMTNGGMYGGNMAHNLHNNQNSTNNSGDNLSGGGMSAQTPLFSFNTNGSPNGGGSYGCSPNRGLSGYGNGATANGGGVGGAAVGGGVGALQHSNANSGGALGNMVFNAPADMGSESATSYGLPQSVQLMPSLSASGGTYGNATAATAGSLLHPQQPGQPAHGSASASANSPNTAGGGGGAVKSRRVPLLVPLGSAQPPQHSQASGRAPNSAGVTDSQGLSHGGAHASSPGAAGGGNFSVSHTGSMARGQAPNALLQPTHGSAASLGSPGTPGGSRRTYQHNPYYAGPTGSLLSDASL